MLRMGYVKQGYLGDREFVMSTDSNADVGVHTLNLPIEFCASDDLTTQFANVVAVQMTDPGVVFLTFYELIPPLVSGVQEEQSAALSKLTSIRAKPVARIALPAVK